MNSSASRRATSTSAASSGRKRKAENHSSSVILSKRTRFMASYRCQSFSLPDSIIHNIAKNPSSSKAYSKLIKCCKYFFNKNPILVVDYLKKDYRDGWQTSFRGDKRNIDIINNTCKLWITGDIIVESKLNLASSIAAKIYKCDVKQLTLDYQVLSYDELLVISSKAEKIRFRDVTVKYEDGSILPFEKVFKAFPKVKNFRFANDEILSIITTKTLAELLKIPRFCELDFCLLQLLSDSFDLEGFYAYIKNNKRTSFELYFHEHISDAYKARIEVIADEIVADRGRNYKPHFIAYPSMDTDKISVLNSILKYY